MILPQTFNPMQYEPSFGGQGGLPIANKMPVVITEHNVKPNSQNTGGFLEIVLTVIDGPHKGASGKHRFNLFHTTSAQAVEIAHKEFTAFCHAMGYLQPVSEVGVLHNLPFLIDAGPQTSNPQYTEVKAVYNMQGVQMGASKTAMQQQQQAAPPAGFAPPAPQQAPPQWQPGAPAAPSAPAWQPNSPAAPVAPPVAPQAPVWTPPAPAAAPAAPPAYAPPQTAPVYQPPAAAPPAYQPPPAYAPPAAPAAPPAGGPVPPWGQR